MTDKDSEKLAKQVAENIVKFTPAGIFLDKDHSSVASKWARSIAWHREGQFNYATMPLMIIFIVVGVLARQPWMIGMAISFQLMEVLYGAFTKFDYGNNGVALAVSVFLVIGMGVGLYYYMPYIEGLGLYFGYAVGFVIENFIAGFFIGFVFILIWRMASGLGQAGIAFADYFGGVRKVKVPQEDLATANREGVETGMLSGLKFGLKTGKGTIARAFNIAQKAKFYDILQEEHELDNLLEEHKFFNEFIKEFRTKLKDSFEKG